MKIKIGVIFGGNSVEHEISIISACQMMKAINQEKYEIIPIYITKQQLWYSGDALFDIKNYSDINHLLSLVEQIHLVKENNKIIIKPIKNKIFNKKEVISIDIAFPVVHGTNGEDGSLQGYLEMLGVGYVGCDVKAAAIGQDKVIMKQLLSFNKLPIVDYYWFYSKDYLELDVLNNCDALGYPLIVKPSSLGSSVGISKVDNRDELVKALEIASQYDLKIIVEKAITNLREVNCSVIGDYQNAKSSVLEEVSAGLLDYQKKYLQGNKSGIVNTKREIPANLNKDLSLNIQNLALETFKCLMASGVSRIDFLIDEDTNEVFINEINTIPGSLSFYLWEASDISFKDLIDELIILAIKRQKERKKTVYSYETNILNNFNKMGIKGKKI